MNIMTSSDFNKSQIEGNWGVNIKIPD